VLDKRAYGSPDVPFADWHDPLEHSDLTDLDSMQAGPGAFTTAPQQAPKGGGVQRVSVQG
jgi:hypothetical protein